MKLIRYLLLTCLFTGLSTDLSAQSKFAVYGYYAGNATLVDSFPVEKLTHLSFSFTHLRGSRNTLGSKRDSLALQNCVALKKRNPRLKVIVSMGGWTGCYTCSDVFAADSSRKIFASSTKQLLDGFGADGIDLDWEYPTIAGAPGHPFSAKDKEHFTALVQTLRDTLGPGKEISFAAGGFTKYIEESVDWPRVTPLVDRINIMTYDLVTGYDTVTGHHTALYATPRQKESCDHAVQLLKAKGVPAGKLLIGLAFYARIWEKVAATNHGLYEKGAFLRGVSYRGFDKQLSRDSGFVYHWDPVASAPYLYNGQKQWFATFDDARSVAAKTEYAIRQKLNGVMFWQLADDAFSKGLLDVIDITRKKFQK